MNSLQTSLLQLENLGITLDFSDSLYTPSKLAPELDESASLDHLKAIEAGEIVNTDEKRMVGHYWLRDPQLAPTPEIRDEIKAMQAQLKAFSEKLHRGEILAPDGKPFRHLVSLGIGGSALGPQLLVDALSQEQTWPCDFLDNTDPDGFAKVFQAITPHWQNTLFLVISKSGGTAETHNALTATQSFLEKQGGDFSKQAIAITGKDSKLDQLAKQQGWLASFPMWDWVGGRTSLMSAVGLVFSEILGFDTQAFLTGAKLMDQHGRLPLAQNPSLQLANYWYQAGEGRGSKSMVILPYRDQLKLFGKYLQQLVMESLGKQFDRDGKEVHQGLTVYGNKGSTDQHAYVQQLREGSNNFFLTFLASYSRGSQHDVAVNEKGHQCSDFLFSFWQGTRRALTENQRSNLSILFSQLDAQTLGALIALYERAVSFYAFFIHVNAYHQPGVEAGKKGAQEILSLLDALKKEESLEQAFEKFSSNYSASEIYHCWNYLQ